MTEINRIIAEKIEKLNADADMKRFIGESLDFEINRLSANLSLQFSKFYQQRAEALSHKEEG